jgi:hypothetical protein
MWKVFRRQSIFIRSLLLAMYEALLFIVAAPFAWISGAAWGLAAAAVAVGLCLAGGLLSLLTVHALRDPSRALTGLLLGTAANICVPLVFGVMIHLGGGPLSQSGFIYYLIFFYLATLAAKTMLTLPSVRQNNG